MITDQIRVRISLFSPQWALDRRAGNEYHESETCPVREVARRIMNEDVADGLLLDLRGVSISDLLTAKDDPRSGIATALKRILECNSRPLNSFQSSI